MPPACTTARQSAPTSPPWPADRRNRPDSASPSRSTGPDSRRRGSPRRRRTGLRGAAETPATTRRLAPRVSGSASCRTVSQRDRLVAAEHVPQVAELETRIGLHQQHADLLLADLDDARSAGCSPSAIRRPAAGPRRRTRTGRLWWDGIAGEPAAADRRSARSPRSLPGCSPAWRACPSRAARSTLSAPRSPRRSACTRSSPRRRRTRRHRRSDRRVSDRGRGDRCRGRRSRAARRVAGRARPRRPASARRC